MSQSSSSHRVADAASTDDRPALGSRDNWWGDPRDNNDEVDADEDAERADPNNPSEIVAHRLLRETATMICASTLRDDPTIDTEGLDRGQTQTTELFSFLDGETWNDNALHTENKAVELTDPAIRLGQHNPESSLVGEWGSERHRKRYNAVTGYISGNETTGVLIQDRPLDELMVVIEQWLRGVAARGKKGLTDSTIRETLDLARGLKKNTHQNGMRDVDIMAKVVEKVRR